MKEVWKRVTGSSNKYEVSNKGRVRSLTRVEDYRNRIKKGKVLKPWIREWRGLAYAYVTIGNKKWSVHRLVYLHFGGELIPKLVIHHKDGNTLNNDISNLEQTSHRKNITLGFKNNTSKYPGVVAHKGKWQSQIQLDGKRYYLGRFETQEKAHEAYLMKLKEYNPNEDQIYC